MGFRLPSAHNPPQSSHPLQLFFMLVVQAHAMLPARYVVAHRVTKALSRLFGRRWPLPESAEGGTCRAEGGGWGGGGGQGSGTWFLISGLPPGKERDPRHAHVARVLMRWHSRQSGPLCLLQA